MKKTDLDKYNHEFENYGLLTVGDIEGQSGHFVDEGYNCNPVADLESDLASMKVYARALYVMLALVVLVVTFFIGNMALTYASGSISDDVVGGASVQVTASVPEYLGYKLVNLGEQDSSYLVVGNYKGGFKFIDGATGSELYSSTTVPGDGAIIKIANVKSLMFESNY